MVGLNTKMLLREEMRWDWGEGWGGGGESEGGGRDEIIKREGDRQKRKMLG